MSYRIGVDEVGRGPVAGPVVVCACAVVIDLRQGCEFANSEVLSLFPKGILKDSKKLSEKNREKIREGLDALHHEKKVLWGIGEVSARRIDEIGIAPSIKEAMNNALMQLEEQGIPVTTEVVLDGSLYAPARYINQETHIKGDEKFVEISLASIIAKVYRDTLMKKVGEDFPLYGFENHVGYGTKAHYDAIQVHGMITHHRKTFLKNIGK
jgi:ribonuclease HII